MGSKRKRGNPITMNIKEIAKELIIQIINEAIENTEDYDRKERLEQLKEDLFG